MALYSFGCGVLHPGAFSRLNRDSIDGGIRLAEPGITLDIRTHMYPGEAHVFGSSCRYKVEKLRALIVDDEHTIADTLALIFLAKGFQATACYSGERALELAKIQQFDFLISDIWMGELNGVEAAIAIRELQPECRILLVSGYGAAAEILHSARENGHTFEILAKPVHPERLFETLRNSPQPFLDA